MKGLWQTLLQKLTSMLRERVHLALTTMTLRHQIAILQRSAKRPQFRPADRCFWVLLSMVWSPWQEALTIVQPDMVRRWRRPGWWHHLRWWCGWKRPGRGSRSICRKVYGKRSGTKHYCVARSIGNLSRPESEGLYRSVFQRVFGHPVTGVTLQDHITHVWFNAGHSCKLLFSSYKVQYARWLSPLTVHFPADAPGTPD